MLKLVKAIQVAWSFLLLIVFGVASMRGFGADGKPSYIHLFFAVVAVIYVGAAFLCQYNNRIAWWVALPIPALFLFMYLPLVVLNFTLFLSGHERYQDSPATIFIVVLYALVMVLPASFIYYGMFRERRTVAAILFRKGTEGAPVRKVERLLTLEGLKRVQLAWAVVLLLYYGRFLVRMLFMMEIRTYYAVMFLGAALYFAAAVKCFSNSRIAWAIVLLLPLIPIARHVYLLGLCIAMRHGAEEVDMAFLTFYYDAIQNLLFFVLPMLFLYYHFFYQRKVLSDIFYGRKTIIESD